MKAFIQNHLIAPLSIMLAPVVLIGGGAALWAIGYRIAPAFVWIIGRIAG